MRAEHTRPATASSWRGLSLAAVLLALAAPAQAQFLTGAQLLEHLDEADAGVSFAKRTIAMGYVSAVYDLTQGDRVCPPEPVAASELMKVVHLFLRAHPERRGEPGVKGHRRSRRRIRQGRLSRRAGRTGSRRNARRQLGPALWTLMHAGHPWVSWLLVALLRAVG